MNANFVNSLPATVFSTLERLPEHPGVYFALSEKNEILYIGIGNNLKKRWMGHHRFTQLKQAGCVKISWLSVNDPAELPLLERNLIKEIKPEINGSRIKAYAGLRAKLSTILREVCQKKYESFTMAADFLGISKQRLNQLLNGGHGASIEGLGRAINKLGYEVQVSAEAVTVRPAQAPAGAEGEA